MTHNPCNAGDAASKANAKTTHSINPYHQHMIYYVTSRRASHPITQAGSLLQHHHVLWHTRGCRCYLAGPSCRRVKIPQAHASFVCTVTKKKSKQTIHIHTPDYRYIYINDRVPRHNEVLVTNRPIERFTHIEHEAPSNKNKSGERRTLG